MTLENDDNRIALDEATNILEESRQRELEIPLGTAYWVGMTLVTTAPKDDEPEKREFNTSIVSKLEQIVPEELIEKGSDEYTGDLNTVVPLTFSQREIEHIGQAALSLPSGRQIIEALPIDPNDRAELEGFRNRHLRAFLSLYNEFAKKGGKVNPVTKLAVEERLS